MSTPIFDFTTPAPGQDGNGNGAPRGPVRALIASPDAVLTNALQTAANLMVDRSGRVMVLDFGLSKSTETGTPTPLPGTLRRVDPDASTFDPDASNNDGSATNARVITIVTPSADVKTTKTGPTSASGFSNITYTIIVTNHGPSTASNVVVSDTLPAGVTFVSASSGGANNSGVVTWTPVENQGPGTNTVVVQVADDGVPSLAATGSFQVVAGQGFQFREAQKD